MFDTYIQQTSLDIQIFKPCWKFRCRLPSTLHAQLEDSIIDVSTYTTYDVVCEALERILSSHVRVQYICVCVCMDTKRSIKRYTYLLCKPQRMLNLRRRHSWKGDEFFNLQVLQRQALNNQTNDTIREIWFSENLLSLHLLCYYDLDTDKEI